VFYVSSFSSLVTLFIVPNVSFEIQEELPQKVSLNEHLSRHFLCFSAIHM